MELISCKKQLIGNDPLRDAVTNWKVSFLTEPRMSLGLQPPYRGRSILLIYGGIYGSFVNGGTGRNRSSGLGIMFPAVGRGPNCGITVNFNPAS